VGAEAGVERTLQRATTYAGRREAHGLQRRTAADGGGDGTRCNGGGKEKSVGGGGADGRLQRHACDEGGWRRGRRHGEQARTEGRRMRREGGGRAVDTREVRRIDIDTEAIIC
jgi:hypothetical protein